MIDIVRGRNEATVTITASLPPETAGVSAVALLYVTKDGSVRSQIRLGGCQQIERDESLELLTESILEAQREIAAEYRAGIDEEDECR